VELGLVVHTSPSSIREDGEFKDDLSNVMRGKRERERGGKEGSKQANYAFKSYCCVAFIM
jgi:hypothetical protein